jgi:valyl-tRNA synthetase
MKFEDLTTKYDASTVEGKWYAHWESIGAFEPKGGDLPAYTITIPPPNITGSLHMGHALNHSVQDLLGRYKRMTGHSVLIQPGQDHAGIATQSVVIKNLKKQGINPLELGREKFVDQVWEWREESGSKILSQFRALGCAYDWSRLRFTLDDDYEEAVLKVFVEWFDRGLIYRGKRVVNWDIALKTSVSDIETERKEVNGKLYHIRYAYADGSGELIIATTRPETLLADVAVAVHPDDSRHKANVGKELILPLVGRKIPLLADIYPDPEFGTGAVKITPGHDPNDFEVGQRHSLEILTMMDEGGKIVPEYEAYAGMDRLAARKKIVADLEEQGLLVKTEDHTIAVMISQRSGEIIEPLASEQWFVKQTDLAQPAIDALKDGRIRFKPDRFTGITLDWMENIRDWCISRQLWWGHRIPIYYTEDGEPFAALSEADAEAKAGRKIVRQEIDVLDTWFSSGLWPFVTLGWPQNQDLLENHYPTDVLVTARDIIYLWVARMMMMSHDFIGKIPFHTVYIHATVLTQDGRRMSKSLGTGIDPMEIIETRGADALRYALLSQTGANQDIKFGERKTEEARNFANKIWNASRFILISTEGYKVDESYNLTVEDRWMLSRLRSTEHTVRQAYDNIDVQAAAQSLYQFFWTDLCDWYIEMVKPRLADEDQQSAPQYVLLTCLDAFLKLMHPMMPFVTEEVYSHLEIEEKSETLMGADWPEIPARFADVEAEESIRLWQEAVRAFRALRAELGLTPRQKVPVAFIEGSLNGGEEVFKSQGWVEEVKHGKPDGQFVSTASVGISFHLPVEGLVDAEKELKKIDSEIEKVLKELGGLEKRLSNPNFTERAKPEVVAKARQDQADLEDKIQRLNARKAIFQS